MTGPLHLGRYQAFAWHVSGQAVLESGSAVSIKWAPINATGIGDNEIIAAVPTKKLRILMLWFVSPLAVLVQFKSGPNIKVDAMAVAANALFALSVLPNGWVVETLIGESFVLNNGIAVNMRGGVNYIEAV